MNKDMRDFLLQPILFNCPQCGKPLKCSLNDIGSEITCQNCNYIVKINKSIIIDNDFADSFPDISAATKELLKEKH